MKKRKGFDIEVKPMTDPSYYEQLERKERHKEKLKKERAEERKRQETTFVTKQTIFGPVTKTIKEWKRIYRNGRK